MSGHVKQTQRLHTREILAVFAFAFVFAWMLFYQATTYLVPEKRQLLQNLAEQHSLRTTSMHLPRAALFDRHGQPLAVSSRLYTLAIDARLYKNNLDNARLLVGATGLPAGEIVARVNARPNSRYILLNRRLTPGYAEQIRSFGLPGISLAGRFERFYPAAETSAPLVGLTDTSEQGIEGMELALNQQLLPMPGRHQVLVSATGKTIEEVATLQSPKAGQATRLSIDLRLQNPGYKILQQQVERVGAESGSLLLLNTRTGECLAVINYPSINPNYRKKINPAQLRNRVFTDLLEPGSTIKPLTIAAVLANHAWDVRKPVDISKGRLMVDRFTIRDAGYTGGKLRIDEVISKSSSVGVAILGLALGADMLVDAFVDYGLTTTTGSGFPGEAVGRLPLSGHISTSRNATMSYGYGLNLTLAQLARAYLAIANNGVLLPLRLTAGNSTTGERVLDADIARQMRSMMVGVTQPGGTAPNAAIEGYTVAGKTGTVHLSKNGTYSDNVYSSLFVGMVPASQPQLLAAIIVRQPRGDNYYGSESAAPVFRQFMAHSLRLMRITPES